MKRPMILSGWYPANKEKCIKDIEKNIDNSIKIKGEPISCVVPHAGWYFCGEMIINSINLLSKRAKNIENVFIFGGHLRKSDLVVLETFSSAQTPLGDLESNEKAINFIKDLNGVVTVPYLEDNTIEIVLPAVKYFFPDKKIVAMYMPPNEKIFNVLDAVYDKFGEKSVFIGAADLTHYGPNYNFFHDDKEMDAVKWVKTVNDKNYIDSLINMEERESITLALETSSSCSPGAAAAAVFMAKKHNIKKGAVVKYSTSYDKMASDSFVGYVGIVY